MAIDAYKVVLSKAAKRDLSRCPDTISAKVMLWIDSILEYGLRFTRKNKGLHDEPLKGKRKGQRSIRLSKGYRLIYTECDLGIIELNYIEVKEVNKHDY